jgi:predicted transcriptional regulator
VTDKDVQRAIERFAAVLVEAAWPRMPARIFSALLFDDDGRMTAAELSKRLQVSPAAISGAVRFLITARLAGREREPGSRRDVYVVQDDAWIESIAARDQLLVHWSNLLREGMEAVGPDTPAGRRVRIAHEFALFMHQEMDGLMKRWNEHKANLAAPERERPGS